jgi:hypothetical protein
MSCGGSNMGDVDRLREAAARDRLRDLPRIFALMAPKKESSAGLPLVGDRAPRE